MPCIMRFCVDRVAYKIGAISVRGGGGGGRRGANDIFHLLTQCIDSVDNVWQSWYGCVRMWKLP